VCQAQASLYALRLTLANWACHERYWVSSPRAQVLLGLRYV